MSAAWDGGERRCGLANGTGLASNEKQQCVSRSPDLFRTARGSFAYPADLAAIAGRPRAKGSFGSVKNRRGVPNPIFFIIFVKNSSAAAPLERRRGGTEPKPTTNDERYGQGDSSERTSEPHHGDHASAERRIGGDALLADEGFGGDDPQGSHDARRAAHAVPRARFGHSREPLHQRPLGGREGEALCRRETRHRRLCRAADRPRRYDHGRVGYDDAGHGARDRPERPSDGHHVGVQRGFGTLHAPFGGCHPVGRHGSAQFALGAGSLCRADAGQPLVQQALHGRRRRRPGLRRDDDQPHRGEPAQADDRLGARR